MKILQLANKLPYPPKDGGAIGILNFTKGFSNNGAEVTMLAMNTAKHYFKVEDLPTSITKLARIVTVDIDANPNAGGALWNFFFSGLPYTASRFISKKYRHELIALLKSDNFDVIQLEGIYMAPYISTIRKYSKAIISLRAHNVEHEIWKRIARHASPLKKFYFENLTKRLRKFEGDYIAKVDVVLPITDRDHQQLKNMGLSVPACMIPAGLNMDEYDVKRDQIDFPTLFHLGALDWQPNIEGLDWFLNKVWPELIKKFPNLRFYIAGRKASENLKSSFNLPNVVFDGEVEDAFQYMNSKAIMVVPLLSGGGMRIKILEGMALGKTIVSTSVGAEGIRAKHSHNILIADDPLDFADNICRMIESFELFEEIGENARSFILNNYDNLALTNDLLNFYKEMK